MRISVEGGVGDLANDLAKIPPRVAGRAVTVVKRNVESGKNRAQRFARQHSGPHGANYYKRITAEMTGPLQGEYGPEGDVAGNAVGAGWRNGPPNTDLPRSADIQGPKMAADAAKIFDRVFW